jgi:hypothetical protein
MAEDISNHLAERPLNEEPKGARPRSLWGRLKGVFGTDETKT